MEPRVYTIAGNELRGYRVVQLVDGEYEPITRRYMRYEDACKALDDIRIDNKEEA